MYYHRQTFAGLGIEVSHRGNTPRFPQLRAQTARSPSQDEQETRPPRHASLRHEAVSAQGQKTQAGQDDFDEGVSESPDAYVPDAGRAGLGRRLHVSPVPGTLRVSRNGDGCLLTRSRRLVRAHDALDATRPWRALLRSAAPCTLRHLPLRQRTRVRIQGLHRSPNAPRRCDLAQQEVMSLGKRISRVILLAVQG